MASNNVSNRDRPGLEPNGQILDPSYELHKAAFHGDVDRVRELLDTVKVDPKSQDMHGKTVRIILSKFTCKFADKIHMIVAMNHSQNSHSFTSYPHSF